MVLLGIFLAVSMIELLTTRVIVLPAQFTGGQAQIANGAATPQGLVHSAAIVSGAFSVAPAIYGACLAGYAADMLYVLPFPFIALATLGVLMPYVSESAGELARVLSVDAIA